jgi:hypothetical protein
MRVILFALMIAAGVPLRVWTAAISPAPTFVIQTTESLRPFADRIRQMDPSAFQDVMRMVGTDTAGEPITLALLPEDSPTAQATPQWIAAFADGRSSTIVVFPARANTYPHDSFEDVVRHEVAHILIARAAGGGHVPRWFHEGLALAAERPWGLQDRTRLMLAITFERTSFIDVERAFGGGETHAARAYAMAGAIVRDLLRRHGADAPARILAKIGTGHDFDRAFFEATGETVTEAERVFWRNSWWHQLVPVLTSSLILWLVVMLLAVYARQVRARRRAAFELIWEQEEAARNPDVYKTD